MKTSDLFLVALVAFAVVQVDKLSYPLCRSQHWMTNWQMCRDLAERQYPIPIQTVIPVLAAPKPAQSEAQP
jgi:hypothetical protein